LVPSTTTFNLKIWKEHLPHFPNINDIPQSASRPEHNTKTTVWAVTNYFEWPKSMSSFSFLLRGTIGFLFKCCHWAGELNWGDFFIIVLFDNYLLLKVFLHSMFFNAYKYLNSRMYWFFFTIYTSANILCFRTITTCWIHFLPCWCCKALQYFNNPE